MTPVPVTQLKQGVNESPIGNKNPMPKPPFNLRKLRTLAGDVWFARGEAYFEAGRVVELNLHNGKLSARVTGTSDYRVSMRIENDDLIYSCTCPLGDDSQFCKHCVAAALAWLQLANEKENAPASKRESQKNNLRAFLEQQDKETLIATLLLEATGNRRLRERLQLEAARKNPSGVDLRTYRKSITEATRTGGFVDYYAAPGYARRIHQVIDNISALLDDGHAKAVVDLTEYTLARLEKAIGEMDDSDGHMGDIVPALQELHNRACQQAGEDPKTLANRIFKWELKSDWDFFSGSAEMYAEVFGPQGLAEYRRLAEAEWKKLPALGPGDDSEARYTSRFRITSIMESLARQSGDYEALVAIKRHDLSHPYSFLQIAEIYRQAGKFDEALDWAEQGMRAFRQVDSRLSDFVADEYHRRGRHAEAMDLIWAQFVESPRLDTYRKLHTHALMSDKLQFGAVSKSQTEVYATHWSSWREKALAHIRTITKAEMQSAQRAQPKYFWHHLTDHSQLVEIFLWENNYEEAWQEATAGGCSQYLWLQLADASAKDHPERSLPIYQELITPTLARTNNAAYDEAIKLLRKMRQAMHSLDHESEFDDYVAALRVEYKRKRNFIKLLDKLSK